MTDLKKKPLVGFFPGFFDIGETYPLIKIAKCYQELGGNVIIFSHGGKYEYLAEDQGFKITRINPISDRSGITRYFLEHGEEDLINMIKNQVQTYKEAKIKALVQTCSYLDCLLSPRVANIPIISVLTGTLAPPFFKAKYATFPDSSENYLTQLIPKYIKNRFSNWYSLNYKGSLTKKINRIAKKINIKKFRNFQDIMSGDYTLICDDMEFLDLKPTSDFPDNNYIGPILSFDPLDQKAIQDNEVENHLKRPGKSILITMGGSYLWKEFFLRFLDILNQADYNVIATYTDILKENELPKLNENILLKKFVTNITELNQKVDLSIIHGGRGSVYTAAYSSRPAIGIPYNGEQQYNLDNLVRHGMAIRLSKTFFQDEELINALNEIFNNYDKYLKNAQILREKLPNPEGDQNGARRILELIS